MTDGFEFDTEEWVFQNLPYFRNLGFFADLANRSDAQVLGEIQKRYVDAVGTPYTRVGKLPPPWEIQFASPLADLCLLEYDFSRTWWQDTECVYPPEILACEDAISRWASISRGAFVPSEIAETWSGTEDDPGNPSVRIRLKHGTLTLEPIAAGDWFDLTILVPINHCVKNTDSQFELGAVPTVRANNGLL